MAKIRVYLAFLFRLGPEILVWEAAFLALCWLPNRYWNLLQRLSFADVLFIMGVLASLMGSVGMLRSPYGVSQSPWGVWASPVQATEEESHAQRG